MMLMPARVSGGSRRERADPRAGSEVALAQQVGLVPPGREQRPRSGSGVDEVIAPFEVLPSARSRADAGWWFASGTFVEDKTVEAVRRSREHVESQSKRGGAGSGHDRARVLESLMFGTWTGLFGKPYEEMWRQHLKDVFPHRPRGTMRKQVSSILEDLRQVRNRLAHHEAIHDLDLETAADRALDLIGWMDPAARAWIGDAVDVHQVLAGRPVKPAPVAVVVAAGKAWPMYEQVHACVCQTALSFRHISHVAFHVQGAIQPEIAQVVDRHDGVPFSSEEVGRLMATKETGDKRLALVMKHGMASGWDTPTYQVFTLTKPGEQGHVTLGAPVPHQVSGRGSAYTQGHRYATVADLERARTTRDLSPWPARGPASVDLTTPGAPGTIIMPDQPTTARR